MGMSTSTLVALAAGMLGAVAAVSHQQAQQRCSDGAGGQGRRPPQSYRHG